MKLTKYGRVDVNSTRLFGTQRGAKHIGRQTQWQTPTYTFGGRNKLYPTNASRHGSLCRWQHQSLLNLDGHYNTRLFKLSCPEKFHEFSTGGSAFLRHMSGSSCLFRSEPNWSNPRVDPAEFRPCRRRKKSEEGCRAHAHHQRSNGYTRHASARCLAQWRHSQQPPEGTQGSGASIGFGFLFCFWVELPYLQEGQSRPKRPCQPKAWRRFHNETAFTAFDPHHSKSGV